MKHCLCSVAVKSIRRSAYSKKVKPSTFFAVSNNLLIAQEFAHNMSRIKKDVRIHQLQGETIFNAYLVEEDTCAIVISYSGGTVNLIDICQLLKQKAILFISVTSLGGNPISQLAEVNLHLATKEKLIQKFLLFLQIQPLPIS